jgi:hypothetical protein
LDYDLLLVKDAIFPLNSPGCIGALAIPQVSSGDRLLSCVFPPCVMMNCKTTLIIILATYVPRYMALVEILMAL